MGVTSRKRKPCNEWINRMVKPSWMNILLNTPGGMYRAIYARILSFVNDGLWLTVDFKGVYSAWAYISMISTLPSVKTILVQDRVWKCTVSYSKAKPPFQPCCKFSEKRTVVARSFENFSYRRFLKSVNPFDAKIWGRFITIQSFL